MENVKKKEYGFETIVFFFFLELRPNLAAPFMVV
jgi:hypothetical protein